MSDIVPLAHDRALPTAAAVTLGGDLPSIEELFGFAREAELRLRSLRMTIVERSMNARGEDVVSHEVLLRHPGNARVTSRRDDDPLSKDYEIWLGGGDTVLTYSARHDFASERARPTGVVGRDDPRLPPFARTRDPLTYLPAGSIADTFVHPHGLFRNVLVTGPLAILGTRSVAGREAYVVRSEHPRSAEVLVDRPDRSIEVDIDRATGLILQLSERIGDAVTHHAEVTALEIDADIPDRVFELHVSDDVRRIY